MKILTKDDNFKELISNKNILVDFYADWCGPCKMLSPVLESITEVEVLKVNVDEFQTLSKEYSVMSIPTMIYFENGVEKTKLIGFKTKEEILNNIK